MATLEQRRAALDALLANGGKGVIGENQQRWNDTVRPGLAGPDTAGTTAADAMWDERNNTVRGAASRAVSGYGAALEALRQQQLLAAQQGTGGGGRRSGGGGKAAPSTLAQLPAVDPWAWLDGYLNDTYTAPPSSSGGQGPYSSSRAGTHPTGQPTYTKPKAVRPIRGAY